MDIRRISAGLIVAAIFAFVPPAYTQTAIVPFKIQVSDAVLADLKQRLSQARFADELSDVGWDYGTNLAYLKGLVGYWRDKYDWRAQEKKLNAFDQFKTNIDGVDIHFIHQRSKNANAPPLLLLNGWPSSIVEYTKVIGPLTDPVAHGGRAEDSFHVIIPSMPGFGFSGKPRERGFNPERMAAIWVQLMARLGYTRYIVHGSDWGGGMATRMALDDAAHVVGLHLIGCGAAPAPPPANPGRPAILLDDIGANNISHNGYQELQSTKPQTVGQALSDSPVGLASWIIEKWHGWTEHDGDLEKVYTKDELLTNIMIYWVTNSGASSARIYYESRHILGGIARTPFPAVDRGRVTVPTGCAASPWQLDRRGTPLAANTPEARKGAEARYNIVHFTTLAHGGHFPAIEQPQLWLDDVRAFVRAAH